MEQEFLMDINLLLMQIEQLDARVHQLCETYRSRLAHPSNTAGEVLQLVLEEEKSQAAKRTATSRDQAPNIRKSWSIEDNELLVKLNERNTDRKVMAEILGRTYNSITNQLHHLGLIESGGRS